MNLEISLILSVSVVVLNALYRNKEMQQTPSEMFVAPVLSSASRVLQK